MYKPTGRSVKLKNTNILKLSGGRDSTAMLFYMLDAGMPIDYIVFSDTQHEFPQMYEYLDKVDERLIEYGMQITRLHHKRGETFEHWCYGVLKSGKLKGHVRGLPMVVQSCYWQRETKITPVDKWIKDNAFENPIFYIGYTYSERKRAAKRVAKNWRYPLIEMKKCEADVDRKLLEIDLINPLYEHFERTGCYFCPYQKLRGFYLLWSEYREAWDYMRDIEHKLIAMDDDENQPPVINAQWNIRYTLDELGAAFESGEILYDIEAPQACECLI